jgi:glycosyltransferase involved in cell wall biosynthesis
VIYASTFRSGYRSLRRREGSIRHLWSRLPGFLLAKLAASSADHIVVVTQRSYERSRGSKVADKTFQLWPAVPTDTFRPDATARSRTRERLSISADATIILAVTRLSKPGSRKARNLEFLIDCIEDVRQSGRRPKLLIVGGGKSRAQLEARAAPLGEDVIFTGYVSDETRNDLYKAADIFSLPGVQDLMLMVYLEAQACGLPVVAFNDGEKANVVVDGETGFLVDPFDRPGFVRRLEQLIDDPELRRSMSESARLHIERNHDFRRWSERLSGLLQAPPPPAT